MPEAEGLYAELAPILFPDLAGRPGAAKAHGLVDRLKALGPELGMQTRLRDVGGSHNHLPMLAEDPMKQTRLQCQQPA
jgi:alcohol dehydrogenase class IV